MKVFPHIPQTILNLKLINPNRRLLAPHHHNPTNLPQQPSRDPLPNSHLSSERELQDGRDLLGSVEDELDAGVWDC